MRIEKAMTVISLCAGSVLTYLAGDNIIYHSGYLDLAAYTVGVLIVGAGIRAVLKG